MKRLWFLAIFLLALPAFAQQSKQTAPELPYHIVPNFFKLPHNFYMAHPIAIAVSPHGNIWVGTRGKHPMVEFNPEGQYMGTLGGDLPIEATHSIRFDPQGDMWFVDAAGDMVLEFGPQKRIRMVLGNEPQPWTWLTHVVQYAGRTPDNFYQPTDVTWDKAGDIFVSDGYGNARVAKFDKNGNFIKDWGERGSKPGQFNTPHNIIIDNQQNLYVADRGNSRIQVFNTDGKLLHVWHYAHPPWSLCITPGPKQVMYVGSVDRIFKINLQGKVLGWFGKTGRAPDDFNWVHAIACPNANTVYAVQELSWQVQKIELGSNAQ